MRWFRSTPPGDPLVVAMTGVKLGDRLLIVGCSHPKLIAQLALKPGLTGVACAVDEDGDAAARAGQVAHHEGALLETETAPPSMLPHGDGSFDIVVLNHALGKLPDYRRGAILLEVRRVLREGGRCMAIEPAPRGGLGALVAGVGAAPSREIELALQGANFRAVRTLAERDGLAFIEGAKRS